MIAFRECMEEWVKKESFLEKSFEIFINRRNESTYVQKQKLSDLFGDGIGISRLEYVAYEELNLKYESLQQAVTQLSDVLILVGKILTNIKNGDGITEMSVELNTMEEVFEQMKQQTLLEVCIIDKCKNWEIIQQDDLLVMISCFKYKPYLIDGLLHSLIATMI